MKAKSHARVVMDNGLDAAIDIIRTYRNNAPEKIVEAMRGNGAVVRLVRLNGTALTASGMLIMLRHRHSLQNKTESLALDAWFNPSNKRDTESTISKALIAIRKATDAR